MMVLRGLECNGLSTTVIVSNARKSRPYVGRSKKNQVCFEGSAFRQVSAATDFKILHPRQMATDGITRAVRCAPAMRRSSTVDRIR